MHSDKNCSAPVGQYIVKAKIIIYTDLFTGLENKDSKDFKIKQSFFSATICIDMATKENDQRHSTTTREQHLKILRDNMKSWLGKVACHYANYQFMIYWLSCWTKEIFIILTPITNKLSQNGHVS